MGKGRILTFLGVQINTKDGFLELPAEKLSSLRDVVQDMLDAKRVTLKQLQVFAGKLNWAASVVRGGGVYLRRVLELMKPLRASHHKVRMSQGMRADLEWWDAYLEAFNGKRWFQNPSHWVNVYVHASSKGGGMVCGDDWYYVDWQTDMPEAAGAHINVKETLAISIAVRRWAHLWSQASVIFTQITSRHIVRLIKGKPDPSYQCK